MSDRQPRRPDRRRRTRSVLGAAILVLATAVLTSLLGTSTPVGHFRSAAAQDRYLTAYHRAMSDLPSPEATLDVRTDFGVVRVYRFAATGTDPGSGPGPTPLLLLPGTMSGTPVWADNLTSLRRGRPVYTLDLLGEAGLSVQGRAIETPEESARWLHQVLLALPEPQLHVLGLSIGGWTATNLVLHHREKVASLILLDPALVLDDLPLETVVRSLPASVPWLPRAWREDFSSWTAGGAPVTDVPVATMIEAGMQGYRMRLPAPARITEEELSRLDLPVLAVLAGRSVMHDARTAVPLAQRALPRGVVELYPDASHAINGEHPEEIAADVERFLADLD